MAQVPTPPASPPAGKLRKASPADNSSPETLDTLLERYLHLLDKHQKLQEELGKQLASGFFSLTQANYSCPPGRRYGEDYYDERMKATRTISVADSPPPTDGPTLTSSPEDQDQDIDISTLLSLQLQTLSLSEPPTSTKPSTPEQEQGEEQNTVTPESESTPSAETEDSNDSKPPSEKEKDEEESSKPKPPRNPITWYGILVPPSLRMAQSSFTSAVEGPIPALAAIVIEMQDLEREIEAARRREGSCDE